MGTMKWSAGIMLVGGLLAAPQADAQFSRCVTDVLDPEQAVARVEWARRCALNRVSPSQGFAVSDGSSPMIDYQETNPDTNPSGQNAYQGNISNFEINATYAYSLFTGIPHAQQQDEYGYYKWLSNTPRQFPYAPSFSTTPSTNSSDNAPLYPHPQLATCDLYTDRSGFNRASVFYVNTYCNAKSTVLTKGVALTGQANSAGSAQFYTVTLPEGSTGLYLSTLTVGAGNVDMYVKRGSAPTLSSYDCASTYSGSYEACYISAPAADTYYVMLKGATSYSGVSLTATWNGLQKNVPVSNLYAGWATEKYYTFYVPSSANRATFNLTMSTGDADLYVRQGAPPTVSQYDCRPFSGSTTAEACTFYGGGTYYVMIRAYTAYTGASLVANYQEPPPPPPPGPCGYQAGLIEQCPVEAPY